ncbi:unnamed protein product [Orchesella dallaii]|uniref:BPTI/Kunitz inhibitor domain-containing protein n=1 Tax=Orchesella dallaii TaxID=48710 RepID=A0ABP1QP32_9HEXA
MMHRLFASCVLLGALFQLGQCDICMLPPDSGSCSDPSLSKEEARYYYSIKNLKCTEMPYSGCEGNANNFKTLEECTGKCGKKLHETELVTSIAAAQKNSQCYFGNRTYSVSDSIPEITADSPCSMGCFCAGGYPEGSPPRITCAQVDCQPYPSGGGCVPVRKSELDCCSDYYCAGKGDSNQTAPITCSYNGKDYVEGQIIYPDDYPCITCHCNKNWKGKLTTEGGVCREVNCGLAIYNQLNLVNKCEPQFYTTSKGKQSCCPIEWKCNKEEDSNQSEKSE